MAGIAQLYDAVQDVPEFPRPGVVFKDLTPLMADGRLFPLAVRLMAKPFAKARVEKVLGIEARGFLLAGPVAAALKAGLILARKPGKLPRQTRRVEYQLEYGTDALEVHADTIRRRERVLVVDDVLATGGTANAAASVIRDLGGVLAGFSFLIELNELKGRARLPRARVASVLTYPRAKVGVPKPRS